jgi:signal transduction histidine kinase
VAISTALLLATLLVTALVGLGVASLLIPMNAREAVSLAGVLALTVLGTALVGFLALAMIERTRGLTLAMRTFAGVAIGALVALANVLIVSAQMFVNTGHDFALIVALVVVGSGVTLLFATRLARATARDVDPLRAALHQLAGGSLEALELPRGHTAEFAALASDIERLRDQLARVSEEQDRLDQERRALTASISHDLRTPLGSIRAMAEALDDGVVSADDERRDYYQRIRRETERLARMIDELFELAQIDAGALRLERHSLRLEEVAAEVVEAIRPLAREASVSLELEVTGEPPVAQVDGARMERAIGNLLRNAIEHTPAGGQILVTVGVDSPSGVALTVQNPGPPIPERDLERVWERFYRGEPSRTRRSRGGADGAGLGLAIVKGIVETHGGAVSVASEVGAGTRFTIRLPADAGARRSTLAS